MMNSCGPSNLSIEEVILQISAFAARDNVYITDMTIQKEEYERLVKDMGVLADQKDGGILIRGATCHILVRPYHV